LATDLPGRLPAAAFNCLAGALATVFAYRLARTLFSEEVARRAAWLACFFPSLVVWSAQTLKEPVVILLETVVLYSCIQLMQFGVALRHILIISFATILLYPFRFFAAYLSGGVVLIALFLPRSGKRFSGVESAVAAVLVGACFLGFTGVQVTKEVQQYQFDLEYIDKIKDFTSGTTGSGVAVKADLRTPTGLGFALSVGMLHLLLAPFPWQWGGSLRMALVIPEVVCWWLVLFYGVLPGLTHCVRTRIRDVLPLLLFIGGMAMLYSLLFANIGLVYRQRAQLLPLLLIFGAAGIELRKRTRLHGVTTNTDAEA
jgi:hypothetical protein